MTDHSIKDKTVIIAGGAKNLRRPDRTRSRGPWRQGDRDPLQQRRDQGRCRRDGIARCRLQVPGR